MAWSATVRSVPEASGRSRLPRSGRESDLIKSKRRPFFDARGGCLRQQRFAWRGLRPLGASRKRAGDLDCQDPGVNLPPILTARSFSLELKIVRPRPYIGDVAHRVVATR